MTGFRDLEWVGFRARSPSGTGAADVGAYGVRPPVPDGPCDVVVPRRAAALAAAAAGRRAGVHGALMADNNPSQTLRFSRETMARKRAACPGWVWSCLRRRRRLGLGQRAERRVSTAVPALRHRRKGEGVEMASLNIEKVRALMVGGAEFLEACGNDVHVTAAADRIRFYSEQLDESELEIYEEEIDECV